MPVIESKSVKIEITTSASGEKSILRLNYRSQMYDFVRVFGTERLEPIATNLPTSIAQKLQQSLGANSPAAVIELLATEYLLVREVGYYSLWQIDRLTATTANVVDRSAAERVALQQASIWLFQELWLQWDELLGDRQLQLLSEDLVELVPQIRSVADLDRLATLDLAHPHTHISWTETESISFARQLYQLTQKKLGHQFGAELTSEIVRSMPDVLQRKLASIINSE
jgi:hypothetical protein